MEKSIGDVSEACGCRVQWTESRLIHREEPVLLGIFIDHLMNGTFKDLTEHWQDTGVTVAYFQSIRIEPSAKLLFIRTVSGLAIAAHTSLRSRAGVFSR